MFLVAILATHVLFLWIVREHIARGDPDFTVFYTAAKMLREGKRAQLYDGGQQQAVQREFAADPEIRKGALPYIHPPFEALLFIPLTYLPYPAAFALWDVLNIGILAGVIFLLRHSFWTLLQIPRTDCVLGLAAFFPVFANFHQGQDAILLLLLTVLGFGALRREKDFEAGFWLGLGIFKYHFMLPLMVILVFWRGRKLAVGFLATAVALAGVSVEMVGWRAAMHYPAYAWNVVSNPVFGGIPPRLLPNLWGLFAGWNVVRSPGWTIRMAAALASIFVLVWVASMRMQARTRERFPLCFACAVIAALLVAYSTNSYDLSLLVLPLAIVGDYGLTELSEIPSRRWALILPVLPVLLSPLWFWLWLGAQRTNVMAIFLVGWMYAIWSEVSRPESDKELAHSPLQLARQG